MCGRFVLKDEKERIIHTFGLEKSGINFTPRYNISPSEKIPVIVQEGKLRLLRIMEWGLIPFWSKAPKPMINARVESLAEKQSFCNALHNRRCVVPASGFFEWTEEKSGKNPNFICLKNQRPMAFAGLWEDWVSLEGDARKTFTIITTKANSFVNKIHQRMPLILTKKNFSKWLNFPETSLNNLILTCDSLEMQSWKVTKEVNVPTFDNPKCLKKVSNQKISKNSNHDQRQRSLFD